MTGVEGYAYMVLGITQSQTAAIDFFFPFSFYHSNNITINLTKISKTFPQIFQYLIQPSNYHQLNSMSLMCHIFRTKIVHVSDV